jgi:glycosyltransferase involved in cell wall biosynthesis
MIRLCIDARMAFSSGIGTFIRKLVPLLNQPPFALTLLVKDDSWQIPIHQILFDAPIYSIKEQILFPKAIPPCDLFWSPHYNVPLLPIRAHKKVATIHDTCHLALGSLTQKLYAKILMRWALKSDLVTTVSHFSKSEIERFFGQRDVEVIPIGVDREQFKRTVLLKKDLLPERFILFVGNFKPHKNVNGLLQAFSKMKGKNLVLVGKGKVEAPENVLVLSEVLDSELPVLYSRAEVFVFPSFYEGFGLPPLEAMSCGCPTVVSNAASIPEVCGEASVYFHPENVEEMKEAIEKVLQDEGLQEALIQKGLERTELFSWEKAAKGYRELFLKLYEKRNHS